MRYHSSNGQVPPTDDAATLRAVVPLSIVTCICSGVDPVVLKVTAPVSALVLFKVMSALHC